MEEIVEQLKKAVPFKDTTDVGDVVLMFKEPDNEGDPLIVHYAAITDFVRDASKRDEWWYVHLVFLEIPPQPQVMILQAPHFTGQEIFTMGGKKVFIKAVDFKKFHPAGEKEQKQVERTKAKPKGGLKVIK